MPRDAVERLVESVTRLLEAGAALAVGDPALGRLAKELPSTLGAMCQRASRGTVQDLVALATAAVQAAAAVCEPARPGAGGSLEPAAPIGSAARGEWVYVLSDALRQTGKRHIARVESAARAGAVADVRLIEVAARATRRLGHDIADHVAPAMGAALGARLRRDLRLDGDAAHGRMLYAIVAAEGDAARPLVVDALRRGSTSVRAEAMCAVAKRMIGSPDLERPILDAIDVDRRSLLPAVPLLAPYASDASLAKLLEAIDLRGTRRAASEALARSPHPGVVGKLLSKLDDVERRLKDRVWAPRWPHVRELAGAILNALALRRVPGLAARAMALYPDVGDAAAKVVIESEDRHAIGRLADFFSTDRKRCMPAAARAACRLGPEAAFERLSVAFTPPLSTSDVAKARRTAVIGVLDGQADARWVTLLLDRVLDGGDVAAAAFEALRRADAAGAKRRLLAALGGEKDAARLQRMIDACAKLDL